MTSLDIFELTLSGPDEARVLWGIHGQLAMVE